MPVHNEETSFFVKVATYLIGLLLGLGAKLAIMNKEKTLTLKEFILHSMVAFACAWMVWSVLAYYGKLDLANIFSVIVGRYSDVILLAAWKQIKRMINEFPSNN